MKKNDVTEILKRISSNYPEFMIDDYKKNEWYKELKDYDADDVMRKVEEHMRSEEYGKFPPKLYFLTKYLQTTAQKNTRTNYLLQCRICGEYIPEQIYDEHYQRCIDVDYMVRMKEKYSKTKVAKETRNKFMNLSQNEFETYYLQFLDNLYKVASDEDKKTIEGIINPPKYKKFDMGDGEE